MNLYAFLRPLIFRLAPETAHHWVIALLRLGGSNALTRAVLRAWFEPETQGPPVQVFGLSFRNPLGLAAGFDKDGLAWRGLACLGFGHLELGTVTPRPQAGNPPPRVFRLVEDQAIINRMGFPSRGAEFLVQRLQGKRPQGVILGVNIGKNRQTPLEEAAQDYLYLLRIFAPLCDYLAINVSSPNTPGLRQLQQRQMLEDLLHPLAEARKAQEHALGRRVPLLVKIAPDLDDEGLDAALEAIVRCGMDGVIVGNTTLQRQGLGSPLATETGGLSGLPLNDLNTRLVAQVVKRTGGKLPVVASGGVMGPVQAQEKLDAGAVLVQLYSGLIYEGPALVKRILESGLRLTRI
ncbi:quinone-dependent dihydroorotate dehydrogenase [uncultured Thermanaerothrix sp.]|uniref:quinone-dependent dihydroorotate dehydrogenase n=1 Tax=uncultured Thermanaerothrix sp. TaxID=1195149 RepID=UPI002608B5D6|nr:quinone-dependent dihydroorotate dehydrogenase [uncultured Thermanaerothrix sp.]